MCDALYALVTLILMYIRQTDRLLYLLAQNEKNVWFVKGIQQSMCIYIIVCTMCFAKVLTHPPGNVNQFTVMIVSRKIRPSKL